MDSLKHVLKSKPSIHTVYFNENGEWQFHPRPGYDKKVDRETALKLKDISEVITEPVKATSENPAAAPDAGIAKDVLLKRSQEAEDFEVEKQIFDEEKAKFDADKATHDALVSQHETLKSEHEKAKTDLKKSVEDHKVKDAEVKDLKAKVASFEKAAKKVNKEDDIIS